MKHLNHRIIIIQTALFLAAGALVLQLLRINHSDRTIEASAKQGSYTLHIPLSTGVIYDRHFARLTNDEPVYYAVVNPTPDAITALFSKVKHHDQIQDNLHNNVPFCCEVSDNEISNPNVIVLEGSQNSVLHTAQHLVGYRQEGKGVCGLEAAYTDWLQSYDVSSTVTFSVNATGSVLQGLNSKEIQNGTPNGGVVTFLSRPIQRITETALQAAAPNPAAAVVMDITSGEIVAMASTPVYDINHLENAMEDKDSPFLNRALCAYPVGSVFKLVIAASALENGLTSEYMYECSGHTEINGQMFRCHKSTGHGLLDMQHALIGSCNPYFISLCQLLTPEQLHKTAVSLGFGQSVFLADGIISAAGSLQSENELQIEAEKANFAFGQGKLLATPLQIASMTACIANDGIYCTPQLVKGLTEDGCTILHPIDSTQKRVLSSSTAEKIREMMYSVLTEGEHPLGKPKYTTAGGKTSTAQTGQYADDGTEYCHAWMTGYFPADTPKYAVTVFVENGGSGNQSAAPIFREIIDHIVMMDSN